MMRMKLLRIHLQWMMKGEEHFLSNSGLDQRSSSSLLVSSASSSGDVDLEDEEDGLVQPCLILLDLCHQFDFDIAIDGSSSSE